VEWAEAVEDPYGGEGNDLHVDRWCTASQNFPHLASSLSMQNVS
jgi:predicted membrane chloride channel (bestrophin family)